MRTKRRQRIGGPEFWNTRFEDRSYLYGTDPNDFLKVSASLLPAASRILLPGDGEGRNGVWLAGQGHLVTSVDWSSKGLAKTRSLAGRQKLKITTVEANLSEWDWPVGTFDAVVLVFLHLPIEIRKAVHTQAARALKPNGLLILEGFSKDQLKLQASEESGGPRNSDMLFDHRMLESDFKSLSIEFLEAKERSLAEGIGHLGNAAIIRLLARRSAPEDIGEIL